MKRLVYWDADAFLRIINRDGDAADLQGCDDVWAACTKGTTHIVTSTLTVTEVIHKKGIPKIDLAHRPLINNFFRSAFISLKPLTREIAELARDVVWDSNIMPKDAIHVATCAYFRIRELHTFDKNLVSKTKIDINGFSVSPCNPHGQAQTEIAYETNSKPDDATS
ncbi:MAG: type II toxin-antitoxin system VapC family toxin [Burkholderiaceae bacterium]|nr:type II toxin-antitoxin system VapC family toxin [Burkholderiaceae bacterium]